MQLSPLIPVLKKYQQGFHPVVSYSPGKDILLSLDFTGNNKELNDDMLNDTKTFIDYISRKLTGANARYGMGGYAEHRMIYNGRKVFNAKEPGEEPRSLHLGTDIWSKPHTPVMAPLNGLVHSFAFNNNPGDYGATIILTHHLEGHSFYTLYGHLSLSSIKNLWEGNSIEKGDIFAEFGIPAENGHWPPHLHFQIITDPGEWKGDYPGVCKFSEREKYLTNCPDADLILQMNQYLNKE
jgi:peptidoglycan LD-endopeptidase LytH